MKYPYYIIAPRYIRTSAGVRVLYRLADLINKAGGSAFVFLWPHFNHDRAASPLDIAPILTKSVVDYHFKSSLTPIAIYPETIKGLQFRPTVSVRYLLNYNDLLFKNNPLDADDYVLAFSEAISEQVNVKVPSRTLFLPVSDYIFFSPPTENVERKGAAFYAGKFKYYFGGKTFSTTDGMTEITRDRLTSQTPEQIRDLFRQIEIFYCYEDSSLALEAILCGCPTVFLPNKHFTAPLGAKELRGLGFAWGNSPEQVLHAKETVHLARDEYLRRLDEIQDQIKMFIDETQAIAAMRPYEVPFAAGYLKSPGLFQQSIDLMRFITDVIKDRGLSATLTIAAKRILAGRFKI